MIRMLAALALALGSTLAAAQNAPDVVTGAGTAACTRFVSDSTDPKASYEYVSWLQGFLGGFNMAARAFGKLDYKEIPNAATLRQKLLAFCRTDPDAPVMKGALELWKGLPVVP